MNTTRGRSNFRQYIPSKPGKYGIKIFWVVDAKNSYPLNGEIYIGCQPGEKSAKDYAFNLVNRLARPYVKKGRTITMDNFFTSCALAEDMIRQKTTIIGTIRSNKPDLPVELAAHKAQDKKMYIKNREVGSSRFCFDGYLTLVSYIPKPNKNVLLLSTLHNNDDIDETSGKPNIILDYNSSKGGVDTMDKLAKTYTCKRITRRWPMVLFFNMIDVAAIAAFNIHKLARPDAYVQKKSNTRKLFLEILAKQLVDQHIRKRLSNPNALKKNVKIAMQLMGYNVDILRQQPDAGTSSHITKNRSRRCNFCDRSADVKTNISCHICTMPACKRHHKIVCNACCAIEIQDVEVIASCEDLDDDFD